LFTRARPGNHLRNGIYRTVVTYQTPPSSSRPRTRETLHVEPFGCKHFCAFDGAGGDTGDHRPGEVFYGRNLLLQGGKDPACPGEGEIAILDLDREASCRSEGEEVDLVTPVVSRLYGDIVPVLDIHDPDDRGVASPRHPPDARTAGRIAVVL